jgi:predicted small integral membrane protein
MDIMTLWVDALLVAALGAWIGIGALENIREPRLNADMVSDVLAMGKMRREYPDAFKLVGGNRVEAPGFHRLVFAAIVIGESVATLLLVAGAVGLVGAALGLCDAGAGRLVAVGGTLAFTMVWSAFLVGGQWFHYWIAEQEAQHTHFLLAIWGVATLVILMRG